MKNSLHPFTSTEDKIKHLLSLEKISYDDLEILESEEKKDFLEVISDKYNELKGTARDDFFSTIEGITDENTHNMMWSNNHLMIGRAISNYVDNHGTMPAIYHLADSTGLSRQTIHKHFKEFGTHPLYKEQQQQLKFMSEKVMMVVFQLAMQGDMRAAKIFLSSTTPKVTNQSNFIQINNTILSQENVKQLSDNQLKQIEEIVLTPDMIVKDI